MQPTLSLRRVGPARLSAYLAAALGAMALGLLTSLNAANDEVIGRGDNTYGQNSPWTGLNSVVGIAAGYLHSLALRPDGSVTGWGSDSYGEASGSHVVGNISIAAGTAYSLSLGNGYVEGWGEGYNGPIIGLHDVVTIAAGSSQGLALRTDGSVVGFGDYTNIPVVLSNVVAVAAGGGHSLALRADGVVVGWAWGYPLHGQETPPSGLSNAVAISAGSYHGHLRLVHDLERRLAQFDNLVGMDQCR
jgi:trimeric autotransporter adhesin